MELWYRLIEYLPFNWVKYDFMKNALLAIILLSFLFGHMGSMVINRQMAFFSEAIGHASLTGIALGVILGFKEPLWGMIGFAVFLAMGMSCLRRFSSTSTDTIIGLFMSFSVALGIMILSLGGSFNKYTKYLIGDILSIKPEEIQRLIIIIICFLIFWIFYFNKLFIASLNSSIAKSRRINVLFMETLFSVLVALVITVSIQWVGLLVINSLLILPPSASRNVGRNSFEYIWISIIISLISGISGLLISFYTGTATGATIVIISMVFFLISLGIKLKKKFTS